MSEGAFKNALGDMIYRENGQTEWWQPFNSKHVYHCHGPKNRPTVVDINKRCSRCRKEFPGIVELYFRLNKGDRQ